MKTFLKILYFALIMVLTFFIMSLSKASKMADFKESQRDAIKESDYKYIQTTTLSYSNKANEAFVYKTPLFTENYLYEDTSKSITYGFDLYFYKFVEKEGKQLNNSLAVIIKNYIAKDEEIFLNEEKEAVFEADITYDSPFVFQNNKYNKSKEIFRNVRDANQSMLIFNYEFLKDENNDYINILDFKISLRMKGDSSKSLVTLKNMDLTSGSNDGVFDNSYDYNIANITSDTITNNPKSIEDLKNSNDYSYNPYLKDKLNSYNTYYVKNILIELSLVIPLTYLLFFHKDVMKLINLRKERKEQEYLELKNKIRKQKKEEE